MGRGIIEIEESVPGALLQLILHPLFIKICQNLFDKEFTIWRFLWWSYDSVPNSKT
jgi:hypothetical protein